MDPDHLDIYGTEEALQDGSREFSGKLKPGGMLVEQVRIKERQLFEADTHLTYSLQNESADVYASGIRMDNGSYLFDVTIHGNVLSNMVLNMGGMHNVENATAAIAVAYHLGIGEDSIRIALADFRGVKRRFDYVINTLKLGLYRRLCTSPGRTERLAEKCKEPVQ